MSLRFLNYTGGAVAALLAVGLGACSSNGSGPSSTPALSAALADSLGEAVASDVGLETNGATSTGASANFNETSVVDLTRPALNSPPICSVTRSPSSPANADGDHVPDSVRVTIGPCVFNPPGESDTLEGIIDIIDPTPNVADKAWKHVFTNYGLVVVHTVSGRVRSVFSNGTRQGSSDSSQISHSETNFQTVFTYANGNTASHVKNWSLAFTADTAGTIVPDSALPSGNWTVNGTSVWTHNSAVFDLTVTTPVPLHHNASCAVTPRFDSGTLNIAVERNGNSSNVSIQFTACGTYTVTRS